MANRNPIPEDLGDTITVDGIKARAQFINDHWSSAERSKRRLPEKSETVKDARVKLLSDYATISSQTGETFGNWEPLSDAEARKCYPPQPLLSENVEEEEADEEVEFEAVAVQFGS